MTPHPNAPIEPPEKDDTVIWAEEHSRRWQCIECGWEVESEMRPHLCKDCGRTDHDVVAPYIMARYDAIGWHD